MARRTFFSFHYGPDHWRASQVRNSWLMQKDRSAAGFFDSVEWQEVKKKSDSEIERWIDRQFDNTSVTVVLIGSNTAGRKWINYEIKNSNKRGNGMLGVYIHNNKNSQGLTSIKGKNPFDTLYTIRNGQNVPFSNLYRTYDWIIDNGYANIGTWIELAARNAGR